MIPVDSSTILRIVIFSAFVGFVLFCASYATQVWLKRNRGNRWVASWVFKVGMFLVICGLLGAGGSWVLNRFVDRSGIVDAGALFVVHGPGRRGRADAAVADDGSLPQHRRQRMLGDCRDRRDARHADEMALTCAAAFLNPAGGV